MSDLEKIASLYNERVKKFGYSAESVGWKSTDQQLLRFQILTQNLNLANQTLLDIGCGFGDLYKFLCESNFTPLLYTGIDVSDEVLKVATQNYENIPGVAFFKRELMSKSAEIYDFAVASGSLNYNLGRDMSEYLEEFVEFYGPRVRKGLLINLLSTKVDYRQEIHAHYSPEYVQSVFQRHFENVRLIEGYGLYEFTIQGLR
jgi:SAM-dependent methyltransferase